MDLRGDEGRQARMVTKAVVLCGGEGTRLRPHTRNRQKTMILIPPGKKGRPLLEYIVRLLRHNGMEDITLLTGYRSDQVERHFGDGSEFGVTIRYSKDAEGVKGSAQALVNAIDSGKIGPFDDLVIYYGDVLSALDIHKMTLQHAKLRAALTLVLSREYKVPVGVAKVRGNRVLSFEEKPTLPLNVTMGCLAMSKECVPLLRKATASGRAADIMTDFVPRVVKSGMNVSPFYIEHFWYDVGTTEAYERLDEELIEANLSFLEQ